MTGTHDAVRGVLDNIAKGAQRLAGALDEADIGRQVVAANRELLDAQKQLDAAQETARQTGLDIDRALVETWRREVDRLSAKVNALIAKGRAEVEAADARLGEYANLSGARDFQVAGRAVDEPGPLDLINFERHRLLLRLAILLNPKLAISGSSDCVAGTKACSTGYAISP